MNKVWKEIKGYEGKYIISNYGEVISLPRYKQNKSKKQYVEPKEIKSYKNKSNGYVYVYLCNDGVYKNIRLHKLVAETFLNNLYNFKQINHKDGNKENNILSNLEFCSSSYNVKDMYKRKGIYDKHKLIIEDYKNGLNKKELSKKYNLSYEQIRLIVKGWLDDKVN